MKFFNLLALIGIIAVININIYAQEVEEEPEETTEDNIWEDNMQMKFSVSHPTVEIKYGMGNPYFHDAVFNSTFESVNSLEVRLGFLKKESEIFDENIYDYSFNYLLFQNMTSSWDKSKNETSSKINTDAWQFGFGFSKGYGYKLGENTDLSLYSTGAMIWTTVDFMDTSTILNDQKRLNYFGDSFRFGDYFEGGINFQVYEPVAVTLAYQQTLIYPRFLIWKAMGSGIVEGVGSIAISWFSGKVLKASPTWGPIVHFVLTNAYSYGYNQLRKKNMCWPFDTDTPLMYDNFKVGVSLSF